MALTCHAIFHVTACHLIVYVALTRLHYTDFLSLRFEARPFSFMSVSKNPLMPVPTVFSSSRNVSWPYMELSSKYVTASLPEIEKKESFTYILVSLL